MDGKQVGISSFIRDEKGKGFGYVLLGHRDSKGGDAAALYDVFVDVFCDYRDRKTELWQHKEVIHAAFGENNVNWSNIEMRVDKVKNDNCSVKYI